MSGSFVFTDIGSDHGGGPVFDPVVKFVNRYRRGRPGRRPDLHLLRGLRAAHLPNRSMVPVFEPPA